MHDHKKRPLHVAIAGIGTLLTASEAIAVNLSPDGRGQVLLYPYYTTRVDLSGTGSPYGTLVSVINATASAKAVRVRFLEGKNSREVLDFNLFLSPYDVWTGAVLPDPATGGARLGTVDVSCTLPSFYSGNPTTPFVGFSNGAYSGANDDGAGTGLDRSKEGYFEIIEMATYASTSVTGTAVTHVNGVAPCGSKLTDAQAATDAQPPTGGLFGGLTLINVGSGTDYTADAVALANFFQTGTNYQAITSALPDLTQATPPVSALQGPDGRLYESTWSAGTADAVSAVLMHDAMFNEYVMDTATTSQTDWVVTMPTKRYYVNPGAGNSPRLFQSNFNAAAGSCDETGAIIWDRDERFPLFFTVAGDGPAYSLCWAANVVTFTNNNTFQQVTKPVSSTFVLGSSNTAKWTQFAVGSGHAVYSSYQDGWLAMTFYSQVAGAFPTVHQLFSKGTTTISGGGRPTTTGNTITYAGLPVIGFALISYTNGTLQVGTPPITVLSNYGGNFAHKFSTTIQ